MYNNFDELIAGIHHSGNIISDNEPAIIIDGYKRTLTPEAGFNTQIAVTNDYNTNEITFKCDKIVDGHDLSACNNKAIKWHNPTSNMMGSDKLEIVNSDDSTFTLTWHVPPEATTRAGTLRIAICFCDVDNNDKIIYKWNSLVYNGLQVAQGMDNIAITGVPLSNIIDVNVYDRTITLPADYNTTIGIQGAPGATVLTFRCNRYLNDWDFLEDGTIGYILYSINKEQKKSEIKTIRTIESLSGNTTDDFIEFDWKVPDDIFNQSGGLIIAISFVSIEKKFWRTKELSTLSIEPSLFNFEEAIPEESEEGWLFISQEALTQLLNEEYKTIIEFYIYGGLDYESRTYQAEEGMTWGEWVTTPYNTYGFTNGYSTGEQMGTIYKEVSMICYSDNRSVEATEVINPQEHYKIV